MSDVGRYRRLFTRIWRHPGFASLNDAEKVIALYLLTGPQTNRIGLYTLSIAQAAEDLGNLPQTFAKRFGNVCQTFGWLYDSQARVLYIPSWWRWNAPENVNVMKGNLRDLNEIPPSSLIDAFSRNIDAIDETLRETFMEGLHQRLPKRLPTQDQYQERNQNPDQKQKPSARRAGLERNAHEGSSINGNGSEVSAQLVATAHETLKLASANRPLEELVDAFKLTLRQKQLGECSTTEARSALNIALADRRVQ